MAQRAEDIAEALEFDKEEGVLSFQGVRYFLLRPETMVAFQKAAERELGERASDLMFRSGFAGGSASSRKYREVFGMSEEETARYMCDMGSSLGWGRFSLVELDEGRLSVEVRNSVFAQGYGSSAAPVCHFTRGVLAGLGETVLGGDVEAVEELCLARGDGLCRFLVRKADLSGGR